ncbi:hypothetical protein Q7P37_006414 [Cladosporium fusiforme]
MSEEVAAPTISRKEKRAQRDAERASKFQSKKKKVEDPGASEQKEDGAEGKDELKKDSTALPEAEGKEAKSSESKKRKRSQNQDQDQPAGQEESTTAPAPKKKQKAKTAGEDGEKQPPANQRFIVFVGNLPYSTTDDSLKEHFKSLQPFTLRHRTDPKTNKSKGFAFLEFEGYDRMKTALKLYHHSYFDPEAPEGLKGQEPEPQPRSFGRGKPKKPTGRKINVELTAGGGGGKDNRKEKIRVKNVRLEEQRERRIEFEKKEKMREDRTAGKQQGQDAPAAKGGAEAMEGIHPSRMRNLQ